MMIYARQLLIVVVAIVAISGCARIGKNVTSDPVAKYISSKCFRTSGPAVLMEYYGWGGRDLLQLAGATECFPSGANLGMPDDPGRSFWGSIFGQEYIPQKCFYDPVEYLQEGAEFEITKIVHRLWGKIGFCYYATATLLNGENAGITVDLPTCVHERNEGPHWLLLTDRWEYAKPLELDSQFVQACD